VATGLWQGSAAGADQNEKRLPLGYGSAISGLVAVHE